MFTGIIQAVGSIASVEWMGDDLRLGISSGAMSLEDLDIGESIATNGVCLTAFAPLESGHGFYADLSVETLRLTTAHQWQLGTKVNLERSLQAQSRLGGHFVSGHVDGMGHIAAIENRGRSYWYKVYMPQPLRKYVAVKGSIGVDGVSLTVNAIDTEHFELTIIPHTLEQTCFGQYSVGCKVNLEVDTIARYLEQLLAARDA